MLLKKKIIAILVAFSAVSAVGITASAAISFRLTPHAGEPSVLTPIEKKELKGTADVLVDSGIPNGDWVGFRVRNAAEDYASQYVEIGYWDMYEGVWEEMTYYSGEGVIGKYYSLASSYASGQSENYLTIKGYWNP